jgi:nucleotide-binding universal stress UspA family protein
MNGFPERILLATDGLENTTLASRAAVDLAKGGGAELHVVHVWHTVPSTHFDRVIRSGLEDAGRETLEEQVRWIEEEDGSVAGAHLIEGRAVEAIIEQAEEIGAGLLIVGSRGMGRLGRLAMGSVSTGLAHRSPCPILIVREGENEWPPHRVLVGYGSFEATERAGLLGTSLGRVLGVGVELVGTVGDAHTDDAEAGLRVMERLLAARADEIEEVVGQRPRVRPLVGDVPRAILDVQAEAQKPILLSFGSKVLGRAGRVMDGKVLDRVLGETRGPILLTPEPHPASKAGVLQRAETGAAWEGRSVLVATDGSEVSLRAGEYAVRLAGGIGAKLFILYVVDEHLLYHSGIHYGEFVEMLSREGREATGKVRAMAEKEGVKSEELIVFGRPEQTILSVAEELSAEPIFLGAEGMSRLEHALIGSVSEEALRRANRTVLVVGGHPEGGSPGSESAGVR